MKPLVREPNGRYQGWTQADIIRGMIQGERLQFDTTWTRAGYATLRGNAYRIGKELGAKFAARRVDATTAEIVRVA